jgi:hypothetical protein
MCHPSAVIFRRDMRQLRLEFGTEVHFHNPSLGTEIASVKKLRKDARPNDGRPLQGQLSSYENDFVEASPSRVLRDGEGSFTLAGPLSRGEVAEVRSFLVFKGSEGLIFPGSRSKPRHFQMLEESGTRKT